MNFFRQFLLNNLGLKVVSILLAFLLWLQIAGEQTVQRTIAVPIEFVNMPERLEISNDYQKEVEVEVRSERSTASLDTRTLSAVIDLRLAEAGTEVIPLSEDNIKNAPYGIEILKITPARIRLELERTQRKIVKVETELIGKPAEGYEVSDLKVVPAEVLVTGPETRIKQIATAETEPVNIEGRTTPFNKTVYLDLTDPRLRIENASTVSVIVVIEEKRRDVRLRSIPVEGSEQGPQLRFSPRTIEIVGTVPISFEGSLEADRFRALVRTAELEPSSHPYEIIPEIVVPPEYQRSFRLKSLSPPSIRVTRTR